MDQKSGDFLPYRVIARSNKSLSIFPLLKSNDSLTTSDSDNIHALLHNKFPYTPSPQQINSLPLAS